MRIAYIWGRNGAREGNNRRKAGGIAFLGLTTLGHVTQLKLGIDATTHHIHQSGLMDATEAGYDSLCVLANGLAMYTQVRLFGKLALTRRDPEAIPSDLTIADIAVGYDSHNGDLKTDSFTLKNMPLDSAVTLTGQMLFVATLP